MADEHTMTTRKSKKKPKLKKLSSLAKKAWSLMSLISRQKDKNQAGYVTCVTCGLMKYWKEMHAGHFFHGSHQRPISYDNRNIHAQCPACNTYKGGARDEYACYIAKRYGPNVLEELRLIKHQGKELKRVDLEELIERLTHEGTKLKDRYETASSHP